jgi:hypothetical protein
MAARMAADAMTTRFDALYRYALGLNWQWAKAIAMIESSEDEYATGDDGLAIGLFQEHPDFMMQWLGWKELSPAEHGSPWTQAIALRAFWQHDAGMAKLDRCLAFHYGMAGFNGLKGADPDGYGDRIKAAFKTLGITI